MSRTIWGNPLIASTSSDISDVRNVPLHSYAIGEGDVLIGDWYHNYNNVSTPIHRFDWKTGTGTCWGYAGNNHNVYVVGREGIDSFGMYIDDSYWSQKIIPGYIDRHGITWKWYQSGVHEWYISGEPKLPPWDGTLEEFIDYIYDTLMIQQTPISYAQKPFNLNILGGDVWNFIAVEPGAWFYSVSDDHKTHHMFLLSGNEFKLLEFQDADGNGVIPHKEYHSTPIVIKGKRYHSLYLSRTVDSVCPFPTEYHKQSEMPSDEYFYEKLSEYICEHKPFERGDVLGFLALRNLLSANSGDVNVDLDDLKAMLKGYTVEERQNPYLDDPNLDDTGHPTVSFHD